MNETWLILWMLAEWVAYSESFVARWLEIVLLVMVLRAVKEVARAYR